MNDLVWDLADLSVEAGLGLEQEWAMLEVYRGGPVPQHSTRAWDTIRR